MKNRNGFKGTMAAVCFAALCLAQGAYAITTQIKLNTDYSGRIQSSNTSDRYTVELPTACALKLEITTKTGDATALPNKAADVRWLNEDNSQVKTPTTSGVNFPYTDENELVAGTYHIEIVQRSGNPAYVGIYNIKTTCYVNSIGTNNDISTAQPLTLGYTAKGTIQGTGNTADIYEYVFAESGVLKITATWSVNNYANIKLYNAGGTEIKNLSMYGNSNYKDSIGLNAGTYYIGIVRENNSTNGSYTLLGDFIAAENNEEVATQHNTTSNAQLLTFGQTIKGLLSYQDDNDMYKYELTEPGRFYITVNCNTSIPGGVYYIPNVKWYNTAGVKIRESTCSYNNGVLKDSLDLERGTYYIGIEKYSTYTGRYTLLGNFTAAGNDEAEYDEDGKPGANNEKADAQELKYAQTVKGFISSQDNIDYYYYNLEQSDILTVNVNVGTDRTNGQLYYVYVRLINAEGYDEISKKSCVANYTGTSYNCNMSKSLSSGYYYIEISRYSDSYTGTYSITAWTGSTKPPATVTYVSISPSSAEMRKGDYQYFTVTVTGNMEPSQSATWEVLGNNKSGTTITTPSSSSQGRLAIDPTETATTLTVKATSTVDPTKFSTATVTVKSVDVTVTFDLNNGEGTAPLPVTVTDGTPLLITKPPTSGFTRAGYVNDGEWYPSYGSSPGEKFVFGENGTPVLNNMTLYLKWTSTHTITFDLNGGVGTVPDPITVTYGSTVPTTLKPPTSGFTKTGYLVDSEWYTSSSGYYYSIFAFGESSSTVYNNTTLYLKWIQPYTITFDANGGTVNPASSSTNANYKLDELPIPTKGNSIFEDWYEEYYFYTPVTTNTQFSQNTTIYAKWVPIYTITFDPKGGTVEPTSSTTTTGSVLAELPIPTKENNVFDGWYTDNYYYSSQVTTSSKFSENTTIYAKWLPIYTITFDPTGGTVEPTFGYTGIGSKLEYTLPTPTKEGYSFEGWFTAETGGYEVTPNTVFYENTTIYARWGWESIYTITFDPNGGSVYPTTGGVGLSGTLVSLPTPTKESHRFNGWFTEETDGEKITLSTIFTSDTTVYARWEPIYIVKFEYTQTNGSTITVATDTVSVGGSLDSLPIPIARTGFAFQGWFKADSTQITLSTTFDANTTVYAQWMPLTYTIIYTPNGGILPTTNPYTYTIETATITLGTPTRAGYTFAGWTGTNGTTPQQFVSIGKGSTGNRNYIANWTSNTPISPTANQIAQIGVQTTTNAILLSNLPSKAKVEVYNLQGKRIYSAHPENPQILTIKVQTKGIYVVKVANQTLRIAVK